MKTLRNIAVGETAKVKRLHGEGDVYKRQVCIPEKKSGSE